MKKNKHYRGNVWQILLLVLGLLCILGLAVLGGAWMWYKQNLSAVSEIASDPIEILIEEGSSTVEIARVLKQSGLIKNELAFRIYVRNEGIGTRLQAGRYDLSPNDNVPTLTQKLLSNQAGTKVTLLEGWRREQFGEALKKVFDDPGAQFSAEQFLTLTKDLEGQLFPDTYVFSERATTEEVVHELEQNFQAKTRAMLAEGAPPVLSQDEILVLASILEREVATDGDLPLVAGVLMNRLEAGWPLQADATLQYAKASRRCGGKLTCEDWWPMPLSEDKELDSAFNTYKNVGLPPAPIANPSIRALRAAAFPTETEFWFYLTDTKGTTHFSKTYEEHLEKIALYL